MEPIHKTCDYSDKWQYKGEGRHLPTLRGQERSRVIRYPRFALDPVTCAPPSPCPSLLPLSLASLWLLRLHAGHFPLVHNLPCVGEASLLLQCHQTLVVTAGTIVLTWWSLGCLPWLTCFQSYSWWILVNRVAVPSILFSSFLLTAVLNSA